MGRAGGAGDGGVPRNGAGPPYHRARTGYEASAALRDAKKAAQTPTAVARTLQAQLAHMQTQAIAGQAAQITAPSGWANVARCTSS